MKFQTTHTHDGSNHDMVVVFVASETKKPQYFFPPYIETKLQTYIKNIASKEHFEAKVGNIFHLHVAGTIPHILLVGIGEMQSLTMEDWLTAVASIGRDAVKRKIDHILISSEAISQETVTVFHVGQGIALGMRLGTYTFDTYKKKKHDHDITSVTVSVEPSHEKEVQDGIAQGMIISDSVVFTRDLVNTPASETTPTYLATVAQSIAKKSPLLTCTVYGPKELARMKMGGLLGIARGSREEPRFIELLYKGGGKKTVVLVGKGITFDTGGLSLKTQDGMETMKIDMAGGAAILGIFQALATLQLKVNVIGLIPATENMPGDYAIKPGDVVRAYDGTTIEVINTDAEGRVILADALSYAVATYHPDTLIDLATLTGACEVALGEEIAGLFSTDKTLRDALLSASLQTGEPLWELPLPKTYEKKLESPIADVANVTKTRWGGAITAALFLKTFVPDGHPWAHLDIAGPVYAEVDQPLAPIGATGYGVRLMLQYLFSIASYKIG